MKINGMYSLPGQLILTRRVDTADREQDVFSPVNSFSTVLPIKSVSLYKYDVTIFANNIFKEFYGFYKIASTQVDWLENSENEVHFKHKLSQVQVEPNIRDLQLYLNSEITKLKLEP